MNISRTAWIRILLAVVVVLAALLLVRLHNASGEAPVPDGASARHLYIPSPQRN